ncbi:GAF domain-like [Acididesulfobacillus acetoxydans]|uniref:Glycerol operon regulatory protein n=1 Tax=Acididesulfobacillus acetoxydans TaxID=1561005 RepID=A0A8S0Y1H7_9FIRM|nr:IclR family transcriptional regulator [Acididesulfobacillus acetoxydans]CAA7599485.1 GAF domain-like [Acididesulfobacillus acetoxydans]CEJ09286.1 Transcriptional regulator KdgR [Acididesulfobacillus acetoxydans]
MAEKNVQTLERSLDVLEVLAQAEGALGVTEIGNRVSLHKSTVYRILQTLAHRGYVERERDGDRYYLGIKIVELGIRFFDDLQIRKVSEPYLSDLANMFDEVVHLVLFDQGEIVYLDKIESSQIIGMRSRVGRRAPMHCTAAGKAILSTLSEDEVRQILKVKGMPRLTHNTKTDIRELLEEFPEIRRTKVARDNEENDLGITCLGTPVLDYSGRAIGGVSVSGPSIRMKEKGPDRISAELRRVGEEISSQLGYRC